MHLKPYVEHMQYTYLYPGTCIVVLPNWRTSALCHSCLMRWYLLRYVYIDTYTCSHEQGGASAVMLCNDSTVN